MTIEDRVRQLLADAVADEPPPRGAPLERALRRRRRRPALAGAVAVVLVLAAVVGLAAVRRERSLPTAVPTTGWKTYTDDAGNLRFRYPPDWRVEQLHTQLGPRMLRLVPPEQAGVPERERDLSVHIDTRSGFWIGEDWFGTTQRGRLPDGQAYLRTTSGTGAGRPTTWSVDWGRPCLGDEPRCVPRSVRVIVSPPDQPRWDRYAAVAETVVGTLEQLRPTAPSTGDRTLPACRPGQWRLVWPEEYAGARGDQGTAIQGGVQYLEGPRCHLQLTVRMAVEDGAGRLLAVGGNPASTTLEADLPVDGMQRHSGSWVIGGALMWRFIWDEWCNRGLPQATLRVSADGGASITVPGLDPTAKPEDFGGGCEDRGRPSVVAGWP
jgi:hypothetical protein